MLKNCTAVAPAVELASELAIPPHQRFLAPRPYLGELRVLLDLEAPALIVGQMPMEAIHLVERQQVDVQFPVPRTCPCDTCNGQTSGFAPNLLVRVTESGVETLRLGLRGDTLKEVLLGGEPAATS